MLGVVLILLAIFVIGPIAIFFGGAIWSLVTGWLSTEDAETAGANGGADAQASSG